MLFTCTAAAAGSATAAGMGTRIQARVRSVPRQRKTARALFSAYVKRNPGAGHCGQKSGPQRPDFKSGPLRPGRIHEAIAKGALLSFDFAKSYVFPLCEGARAQLFIAISKIRQVAVFLYVVCEKAAVATIRELV